MRQATLFRRHLGLLGLPLLVGPAAAQTPAPAAGDPLPSWKEGPSRQAILGFLRAVTTEGSPDFVPVRERIAVFDNDGTLWCEIPTVQAVFMSERLRELAPQHPEWQTTQPFKAALENDAAALHAQGERGAVELLMATHAGNTPEAFNAIVRAFLDRARHPTFDRPYTRTIYQPMLEVLRLTEAHGFRNYIVSGGGIEFVRAFSEATYGIPPEQVIGSSIRTEFRMTPEGRPELRRMPAVDFVDDGPGKPVAINRFIGRRPIAAFGNSDGDLQMIQYVTAGPGRRFGLIVHHDDAAREAAYDRQSHYGRLDKALDLAPAGGWTVVSMRDEWLRVFPDP